jgi:hypothetical protein
MGLLRLTAFSILLLIECGMPSGNFLDRGPTDRSLSVGWK